MRATELIRELQGLVEAHGDDLEVYLSSRREGGACEQLQLKDYPRQINPQPDGRVFMSGPAVVFSPVPEPQEPVKGHETPTCASCRNFICAGWCQEELFSDGTKPMPSDLADALQELDKDQ